MTITTTYVHPPIPFRHFDWLAYYDADGEEGGRYGHGKTEQEAVEDLHERYGEDCQICGEDHGGIVPLACATGDGY